jgi:hypothetical protein
MLSKVTGPVDGHPDLLSSFHSEINGLLSVLYIIYKKCHYYGLQSG